MKELARLTVCAVIMIGIVIGGVATVFVILQLPLKDAVRIPLGAIGGGVFIVILLAFKWCTGDQKTIKTHREVEYEQIV